MAYKLFIIFMLFFKISYSNIIYDKNENSVTELELDTYIELYKNSFNQNLSKNKALKNLVLIKNTIHSLEINNPDFISELDEILISPLRINIVPVAFSCISKPIFASSAEYNSIIFLFLLLYKILLSSTSQSLTFGLGLFD